MVMAKCKECGNQVSTEAKACPSCGAKPPKKPASRAAKILAVLIVGGIVYGIAKNESKPPPPPPTPAEIAREKQDSDRHFRAKVAAKVLKESMRDPDSFVLESLRASDDGQLVCAEYRSRNGFGGMNRGLFIVDGSKTSSSVSVWNKRCLQGLTNMMYAAKDI